MRSFKLDRFKIGRNLGVRLSEFSIIYTSFTYTLVNHNLLVIDSVSLRTIFRNLQIFYIFYLQPNAMMISSLRFSTRIYFIALFTCLHGPLYVSAIRHADYHITLAARKKSDTARHLEEPSASLPTPYEELTCEMRNFTQLLDHFSATETRSFSQRYYICPGAFPSDATKRNAEGNVIVFLGNESPLTKPLQPIVFENAARMKALIVQVEVRESAWLSLSSPHSLSFDCK